MKSNTGETKPSIPSNNTIVKDTSQIHKNAPSTLQRLTDSYGEGSMQWMIGMDAVSAEQGKELQNTPISTQDTVDEPHPGVPFTCMGPAFYKRSFTFNRPLWCQLVDLQT